MSDLKNKLQIHEQLKRDRIYELSQHHHARINLGHTGGHLKSNDWLAFQADFAQAKDAVTSSFAVSDVENICRELKLPAIEVYSQANDLVEFLLRPDLGRLIADESQQELKNVVSEQSDICHKDLLIVISGGLSPVAIQKQIPIFLPAFIELARKQDYSFAPICINPRGRVALGDHINQYFQAKIVIMLIGERPGLTTPDSMGIYFTYHAKPGCTDEMRNCISNIHQQGLTHVGAAEKLVYLMGKSLATGLSGIMLKDEFIETLKLK